MPHIPIHVLNERAEIGLEIKHFSEVKASRSEIEGFPVHRDDHYVFLLIESGIGSMDVDFKQVTLTGRDLYFVTPGQIHHNIKARNSVGWLVLVDPSLIPKEYSEVFNNNLLQQKPCPLGEAQFLQCQEIVHLLNKQYTSDPEAVFYKQLTYALLDVFLCATARAYVSANTESANNMLRTTQITKEFRKLLQENYLSQKSPSYYASRLNISEAYLNEAIKKTIGFTVTYWIQQQIVLEAKRLLCFSKLNVKEIAHALGYDDHTYFSKLFKQSTQTTPLAFRDSYLK
ncbi:AraC family transcriptional activator of pobA [Parabacteroides sp. PF5-5]|uniref:AraC family transcriptional regulator n=1 Tax=unclassified Parabacteroides TaxID=2649774 RepID=UPI00247568D4|nr:MULTISPECIES: helix-turn-helix transcriptional regulator [unclassified Parabacteroides]MDH6303840.1 AraC family transcriptional activator of pobA [Parabacteroides sp. PH5-39]MDH6314457.1 AraC family transcriptional activator of pobA [Parabacteroides sp. PF5-13]MDH6318478.1 AraC family transcriptional activator of pobA [Parabacteroides sp. PH5-13]MDH6322229.1 AraC family transcriptional activator of pobA [Parabacteroides sp. PH5-8]MDH6325691.1 AraC family transcriptional activator of pobA [P